MDAHAESGLEKGVWSDADFERMGWHDVTIHALSVERTDAVLPRLLFDLDYVVRWVHPTPPETYFSFWVAPATLVFEDVWDLEGDLDFSGQSLDMEIDALHRLPPKDDRPVGSEVPLWHIEGHAFDLRFRATGFRQFIRQPPRLGRRRVLGYAERGGASFAEMPFM
ncbi:hypothetical protein OG866_11500 [Streptomyces sp. NBC_00663]|uniref:hypothetical protein n=1 Tax=Streptomyces sp. NBC_00663 TaxID=2975801 RepID=UPI002E337A56|nr:hypothetical protein [Streptomyces sp. NBC_00663]